ncbi:alpha-glucosidase C-terminal domain-containing protein, partial [Acinetobacter baumannii]
SNNDNQIMAYLRRKDEDVVLVLLNVSPDNRIKVAVSHDWLTGIFKNIFSDLSFCFQGNAKFELQAGEFVVYVRSN